MLQRTAKFALLFVAPFFLGSCGLLVSDFAGTLDKTNKLFVGMTKVEVIEIMGKPDTTRAKSGDEYLTYLERTKSGPLSLGCLVQPGLCAGEGVEFIVRLVNGRVDAYGVAGDFDLTKDPAANINLSIENR